MKNENTFQLEKVGLRRANFEKMSGEEIVLAVETNEEDGLQEIEADKRLKQFGPNQIPAGRTPAGFLFLKKFWGITPWMLEAVMLMAFFRRQTLDGVMVTALLFFNAVLGFFEEQRASRAVETLKKRLQIWVRTLRDGFWKRVAASHLVPGDIIRLRSGDFVPADIKLLSGNLEADLSALTGESGFKSIQSGDLLYSGAVVKDGEGTGVVLLTGSRTSFGQTAELVRLARPKLHFEEVTSRLVRWLLLLVGGFLLTAAVIWKLNHGDLIEILPLVAILLVSAVPVALPAMFTLTLAMGSNELVKAGILVTCLNTSEDAARMDVLCSDKTGTLTANQLAIARVMPAPGYSEEDVLRCGWFASQEANQDPIDLAFIETAERQGLSEQGWYRKDFIPFNPAARRTEAKVVQSGREFRVFKGALEAIFDLCGQEDDPTKEHLQDWAGRFGKEGYRTLAVAREESEKIRLVGLAVLYDPLRVDSKPVVQALENLGIRVKILTGDALPVAAQIAGELGFKGDLLNVRLTQVGREVIGLGPIRWRERMCSPVFIPKINTGSFKPSRRRAMLSA